MASAVQKKFAQAQDVPTPVPSEIPVDDTIFPMSMPYPPNDGSYAYKLMFRARVAADQENDIATTDLSAQAIQEAKKSSRPLIECASLCLHAIATATIGLRTEGLVEAQKALDIAQTLNDDTLKARAFCAIAFVALETHDEAQAADMLERALKCARAGESDLDQFWSLNNLAHIYGDRAERSHDKADIIARDAALESHFAYAQESLVVAKRTKTWRHLCFALLNLSKGAFIRGDLVECHALVNRYSDLARQNQSFRLMAYANLDRAKLLSIGEQVEDAIAILSPAEHLETLCQTDDLKLRSHQDLAQYHKTQKTFEQAVFHLEAAFELSRQIQTSAADRHISALMTKLEVDAARARADRLKLEATALEQRNKLLEQDKMALSESAMRDALTNLGNRRAANEAIANTHAEGAPFCLAYTDLDHFKSINDRFGHQTGDDVLITVGHLFESNLRNLDRVFRIGGEEFLLLIHQTDVASAAKTCERVRVAIAIYDWKTVNPDLNVTASFGLSLSKPGEDTQDTISRADKALYAAKQTGRNRIVLS